MPFVRFRSHICAPASISLRLEKSPYGRMPIWAFAHISICPYKHLLI